MSQFHEQYVSDQQGQRTAVLLPMDQWSRILEALDELDAIHAYDEAKAAISDPLPFAQAMDEIARGDLD